MPFLRAEIFQKTIAVMQGLHMCGPRPARKQPSAIHGRAGRYYHCIVCG